MNLDKLINSNNLFERLDKLYPDTTSGDKNDGINYWKGKKIVSLAEWRKIANSNKAFQKGVEHQNTKEALQYFPDDYSKWPLFPLGVQEELIEATNEWYLQYRELMQHRKNPNYGKTKCYNCLLSTDREEAAIFIGINKVMARALENKDDDDYSAPTTYPCPIQNRFECPYEKEKEEAKSIGVDQLFQLSEIAFIVELAFATAEKDTSKIQIKNVQDVYNALTDREMFDKLLQQGLDKEHQKHKDETIEFFMAIKAKVRIEDLTFYE
ncbi:MAG: hypothetical protein M3275_14180 [Thermoproteota archaeon]|nr:hypothetical protein [Thermoproteota archaeon]